MTRLRRFQLSCSHVRRFGDGFAPGLVVRCSTCRDDRAIAVRLPDRPGPTTEATPEPDRYVRCTACACALSIETTADDEECPRCGLDTLTVVTDKRGAA